MAGAFALMALVAGCTGCAKDRAPAVGAATFTTGGVEVHGIERGPSADKATYTVLFLHGQSYTSRIWDDRGILDAVATQGYRAVAIDLPGYGDTPKRSTDDTKGPIGSVISDGTWLKGLIDELGGPRKVVVVSPSMSGQYSLAYLQEYPADDLAGFVPVAPVGIDQFERGPQTEPIPARSIWGSEDPTYTPARAKHLIDEMDAAPQVARTSIIPDASHACYDDHPKEFTALLLAFLGSLGY